MHDPNDDLSAAERADMAALPRERMPSRLLEERTVNTLRDRGHLRRRPMHPGWVAAAAAIIVALFTGGFATGQWSASRSVQRSLIAAQHQTAIQAARMVQQTGSAYVTALVALAQISDSAGSPAVAQGREAAVAALYAAARELVGLVPDDPVAIQIRRVLEGADPSGQDDAEARNVVWF